MVSLIVGLVISVGVILFLPVYGPASEVNSNYTVSFNESRIFYYSSAWCSSALVKSTPKFVVAAFYLLDETPKLTDHDAFNISYHFIPVINKFEYYSFYLYPGSSIFMDVCTMNVPLEETFLFIVGDTNFEKWQHNDFFDPSYVRSSFKIERECDKNEPHHFVSHVIEENYYYMIFFSSVPTMVNTSFQFYRTKLAMPKDKILNSCYVFTDDTFETCYLDIPYTTNRHVALVTNPPTSWENDEVWLDSYTINIECQDRISLYVAIAIAFSLAAILAALVCAFVHTCVCVTSLVSSTETVSDPIGKAELLRPDSKADHTLPSYGALTY